jgi:putative ABC transport system ATP-binding protein
MAYPQKVDRENIDFQNRSNGQYNGSDNKLVELIDVVKKYESPAGQFVALKGINLTIERGEFSAVVGKSGSGKSTLMNMITGIDRPTSGEVYVDNVGIHLLSEGKVAIWRGKTMGIVFQFFQLLPTLSVIENIMLPMDFCHMYSPRERRDRASYLLHRVELLDQADKLPSALSGGQQQRVAIARALANDPPIIVADEPTGNLDSKTADSIFKLFEELVDDGKTILMVTHDQDMAKKVSRTIYLVDGKIVNEGEYFQDRSTSLDGLSSDQISSGTEKTPYYEELISLRNTLTDILNDPSTASERLKSEVIDFMPDDSEISEVYFQVILDEVRTRAERAEKEGKMKDAQTYWNILLEATV